jgi:pimeloyl-ACP methyl ester carboxylesterase
VRSGIVTIWLNTPIEMQFRVIDGLTVRFAQSEDRDDHALLLSPWPESLLAFEPVWLRLAEHTHLVAIDLPGFGHSQRDDALLSPRRVHSPRRSWAMLHRSHMSSDIGPHAHSTQHWMSQPAIAAAPRERPEPADLAACTTSPGRLATCT